MKIGIVLVTYNRMNDLKKALSKYESQIKKPEYILVVNNNSSDGTREMLKEWKMINCGITKYVINLDRNIGGSGGFYTGLQKSLSLECDWIWVADDDAYPYEDALENAEIFLEKRVELDNISAICGTVINNGKIDTSHRRRITNNKFKVIEKEVMESEYEKDYFELNLFSYVGSIINKKILKDVGITEKEYFIYCDDTEHSYRLSKVGKIFCVPTIKISHDVELQNREEINWKRYYGIRNKLLFYKKHFRKRYFWYEYFKNIKKILIGTETKKNIVYKKLIYTAIRDARKENKGLHSIYKPGWKCNE